MAVIFKHKSAPVQSTATGQDAAPAASTKETEEALIAAGLLDPKPIVKAADKKQTCGIFSVGDRVKVTNTLYTWIDHWKVGDEGVVVQVHPAPQERQGDLRYGCVVVDMDHPRVKGRDKLYFHAWELERLPRSSSL